LYVESNYL